MILVDRKVRYWFDAVFGRILGQDRWRLWKAKVHVFIFRNLAFGTVRSDIVYSLTSYPQRQDVLKKTVLSILGQNIIPSVVQIVISKKDWPFFSVKNRSFLAANCVVKLVDSDFKSYKKLFFSLQDYPSQRIVTFDDDIYYEYDAVGILLKNEVEGDVVLCRRAHVISLNDGVPNKYLDWDFEVVSDVHSNLVFPTSGGVMMVLPNAFSDDVLDYDVFMNEAGGADDMWWYFNLRKSGGIARKCGGQMRLYEWHMKDSNGLYQVNLTGGNDRVFRNLQKRFNLQFGND